MERMHGGRFVIMVCVLVQSLALLPPSAAAYGVPEGRIVRVDKPVSTAALAQAGMLFLVDLGDAYLVEGTKVAAERLSDLTDGVTVIASLSPGKEAYLLRPKSFPAEILYSGALIKVGEARYLAQLGTEEINDFALLPFSKVRLRPYPFPGREEPMAVPAPLAITPKPEIESMVAQVSGDTVWKYISQLSGEEPVLINGLPDTLLTRYSFSWRIDHAADYLRERFEEYGVDVEFQEYVQGAYDFYDLDFVDDTYGWVAGYRRIFKTADGGLTWVRQKTGGLNQIYLDVCFLDSLEGWIAGYPGIVYHTTDGGASWINQPTPGGAFWIYDVFFLDSSNGWIAGDNGEIASTTDGGQTWASDTTGTSESLYGLWFASPTRGWACGGAGTILFWDGVSWSSQTSGASDFIRDLCFVDGNTGWAVGADRAMLKTTDGGQTWVAIPIPASPNPYLMDVCFVDSSEGWVVEYDGTIRHTTDGGATWDTQHADGAPQLYGVDFINASEGWAAGYSCAIQQTDDGGAAWNNQTTNLPVGAWTIQKNVVGTKEGTVSEEEVIICGHYDSVSEISGTRAPGADAYVPTLAAVKTINPGMVYSDHASFWRLGYHALDCAEDSPVVYPKYHTTGDTLGNLDQAFAASVIKMGLATVAELAIVDTAAAGTEYREIALLTRAYPNPFKAATRITFVVHAAGEASVYVFDVEGRLIKALLEAPLPPGRHEVVWDGTDERGSRVSPGVYFARIRTGKADRQGKVVFLR